MKNKITSIFTAVILLSIIFTSISINVSGGKESDITSLNFEYYFDAPQIKAIKNDEKTFDSIDIQELSSTGNSGTPKLPVKEAYILLPCDTKVKEISVSYNQLINLGSGFYIEPCEKFFPLSKISTQSKLTVPDEKIYNQDQLYPDNLYTNVGTFNFRGYKILILNLYPIQYIPKSGELFYYPKLNVDIQLEQNPASNALLRDLECDKDELIDIVENPSIVETYSGKNVYFSSGDSCDLIIITSDNLKNSFEPLKNEHEKNGLQTEIVTVEYIENVITGEDTADKIRNYIDQAYSSLGISYVLLGGDVEIIPMEKLGVEYKDIISWEGWTKVPSDMYYSCLGAPWNKPENPHPSNKDISIEDSGIECITDGFCKGPQKNVTDYKVGTSSMMWTVSSSSSDYYNPTTITFTFNTPLDISNAKWFNLYGKKIKVKNHEGFVTINSIKLVDENGQEILKDICDVIGNHFAGFSGSWDFFPIMLPVSNNFNYEKLSSLTLEIVHARDMKINDIVLLDGLHFTEWCDEYPGEEGELEDILPEVYIGRASVSTVQEAETFVTKTISYMNIDKDEPYLQEVLLAGEYTGFDGVADWGGNLNDELIDSCDEHGYSTTGFPSDKYNIKKLYDKFWRENGWEIPGYYKGGWPTQDITDIINENVYLITHSGHSRDYITMKMNKQDVGNLTNEKLSFITSCGCWVGAFDKDDCIAEYLTIKTPYGAFAGLWNTRYGWGARETTDQPSQRYIREFWDGVYREGILELGRAAQYCKTDNLWRIDQDYMKYCYYEITLFGDPAVSFIIHDNIQPDKPQMVSGPTSGKPGEECTYQFKSSDPNNDKIKYTIEWGDGTTDTTDLFDSGNTIELKHTWDNENQYQVNVTTMDEKNLVSGTLEIQLEISKSKQKYHNVLQNILSKFLEFFQRSKIL